jgi:kumamolisin
MFFGPDADPTIPVALAGKILAIGGLDSLAKYKPHLKAFPMTTASPKPASSGPPPEFAFITPQAMRTEYNLNSIPADGSGQSIALLELDGYSNDDIKAYESGSGLPDVPLQNILIDGFGGSPGSKAIEPTADIQLAAAFAPGISNIFVYEGPDTTQGWIDVWTRIAEDNKAKAISCSWLEGNETDSPTISFDRRSLAKWLHRDKLSLRLGR